MDFSANQLVAVFRVCSTGGYGVAITHAEEQAGHVMVHYSTSDPPKGAITIAALTQPHDVVAIPRTEKTIRFAKHEAAPAAASSTYMLTLNKGGRAPAEVIAEVQALSSVRSVKHLKTVNICIVDVDTSTDATAAAAALRAVDGVKTVERDA